MLANPVSYFIDFFGLRKLMYKTSPRSARASWKKRSAVLSQKCCPTIYSIPIRANPSQPEPAQPEPAQPEPAQPEPDQTETVQPEPASQTEPAIYSIYRIYSIHSLVVYSVYIVFNNPYIKPVYT